MELLEIRKWIIIAMFSDDVLFERLVLKGGNAIHIVHRLGQRASRDVDFSIPDDFEDIEDTKRRIFAALMDRFESLGYVVFDERFELKPPDPSSRWGGYGVEFKLIEAEQYRRLRGDLTELRKRAELSGGEQQRKFRIQISKYEYCDPKESVDVDGYTVHVYTAEMIVAEKLRALCQQMDEYDKRANKTARGRDFYDIFVTVHESGVDLSTRSNLDLVRNVFQAKDVPLSLLSRLGNYREFHRQDWASVVDSVAGELRHFDFYFDFALGLVDRLKSLWEV